MTAEHGYIDGKHYQEWAQEAEQLRREGRFAEAEPIMLRVLEALEHQRTVLKHDGVVFVNYERLAIMYRQQKRYSDEVAALERYCSQLSYPPQPRVWQRLQRARQLAGLPLLPDQPLVPDRQEVAATLEADRANEDSGQRSSSTDLAAFIDVETTGLSPERDQIIEFAVILFAFHGNTGQILGIADTYSGLREPTVPISPGAQRAHGIRMSELRGKSLDRSRITGILDRARILIAHNASFDRGFVQRLFPETAHKPWYCSMNGVDWRGKGFESKGLQQLLRVHRINPGKAHRAVDDARAGVVLLGKGSPRPYLQELLGGRPIGTYRSRQREGGQPVRSREADYTIKLDVPPRAHTSGCSSVLVVMAFLLLVFAVTLS